MKPSHPTTHGSTLPAALIIVMVLCVLIAAAFEFTIGIGRDTQGAGAVQAGAIDLMFLPAAGVAPSMPAFAA